MNLGDANLRTVNTSRPELVHSNSKQSVTASDDYYSLSSSDSSHDDRGNIQRYETPPLHTKSREKIYNEKYPETANPTVRIVPHAPLPNDEKPANEKMDQGHQIKRKPISKESPLAQRLNGDAIVSPPTPGFDDTPYIQFALEQLTRDEEVNEALHSRMRNAPSTDSYPVERLLPEEILRQQRRQSKGPPPPIDDRERDSESNVNIAVPVDSPGSSFQHPNLNYLPKPLRLSSLVPLLIFCLLMGAAMIFSSVWSSHHQGLWEYNGTGTNRYFVFQYLPQLLSMAIIVWLIVIFCALHRILPFVAMHSGTRASSSRTVHATPLFPTNFLIPSLWNFQHGRRGFGMFGVVVWISFFSVPLQSCLYQTRLYRTDGHSVWRWTSVHPVAWTLLALYVLLAFALLWLVFELRRHHSGLKWDPRSLADMLVLFQRSNILTDFLGSEVRNPDTETIPEKVYALRYWATNRSSGEIFHGIQEPHVALEYFPRSSRKMGVRGKAAGNGETDYLDVESQRPYKVSTLDSLRKDVHSPFIRYGWLPWFLKDTFIVAWMVIFAVLSVAFVAVSFVNHAVERGFLPLLPAPTTSDGFSPADFLYSFLPSFVGMVLFLLWQPIDLYFRALEPFANLAAAGGSQAESSLLLDYGACLPVEATIKAILAGHYKVAWISFVSLMSATLPVISGGIFTAQFFVETQDIRMAASMPGYYALVVFVVLYGLSFMTIWPTRKRRLPHDISTLGQVISFVYESQLLNDSTFWQPRSKIDLVTRLLGNLTGDKGSSRYAFGVYIGRNGKEHLGIDRLHRPHSGEMLITTGTIKS